jgi:hypothetical protein
MGVPDHFTVLDTKQKIGRRFHVEPEYVSLFFAGRELPDTWLLSRQRVGEATVLVLIRSMDPLLLQSVGYGSRCSGERPPDFVARVDRLEAESGKDRRTCSRCLLFYDYDTERALAALMFGLDD